ncbi:PepSY domain-containing protein [Nonomuraea sp. NPDC048882]
MQITKKFIVAGAGIVALIGGGGAAYAATTSATTAAPKVTAEQAIDIAHKTVPGAWVSELDFDARGSRADVWELELTKGSQRHEVDVDASSGKVVKNQIDKNDRDDDNDGDDD